MPSGLRVQTKKAQEPIKQITKEHSLDMPTEKGPGAREYQLDLSRRYTPGSELSGDLEKRIFGIVKLRQIESRIEVITRGLGQVRLGCLLSTEFQFGMMKTFWKWIVVMAVQQCECT